MMQKYFTKEIAQPLKIIIFGLAIGLGVSFVSANWTPPQDGAAPNCVSGHPGCDAPVNISATNQAKAGNAVPGSTLYIHNVFGADNVVAAQSLNAGSASYDLGDGNANIYGQFTIDRSSQVNSPGRDLINLVGSASNGAGNDSVGVIQNKPWFHFWDYSTSKRASLRAYGGDFEGTMQVGAGVDQQSQDTLFQVNRAGDAGFLVDPGYVASSTVDVTINGRLKINDGNQATGKVFASTDANGLGAWSSISGGGLDIKYVSVVDNDGGDPRVNKVYCPVGYKVIGGGGDCQKGQIRISRPITGNPRYNSGDYTWSNLAEANTDTGQGAESSNADGWMIACSDAIGNNVTADGDIHVDAICAKSLPVVVTLPTSGGTGGSSPTWHYAGTPNDGTVISCWGAYGTTNGNVGIVSQTLESASQVGPWNFTQPANITNVDTSQCPVTGTSSPFIGSANHVPSGRQWTSYSTGVATWSSADQVYTRTRYWAVERY